VAPRARRRELNIPSGALDKVAVDLAPIDRFSVDLGPFPVDPARIDRRPVDCWRASVTHMGTPPDNDEKRRAARMAALEKALNRSVKRVDVAGHTRPRGTPFAQRRTTEHDLIDEITSAAQRIDDACDWNGEPVYRTDGIWRVLVTVANSSYCLAIADLGRALLVRKQRARELAHAAVQARVIELAPNPHDKRLLQALVTPRGRAELAAARVAEDVWLATLLNGLGDHELQATLRVVRVIRQRLERDARELKRHKANLPKS
jgi:DNA-binding MarR family transcriptional regulator